MVKTLIHYQIYIILGILTFPFFAFIIYSIKQLIDKAKFVKALQNMKKPLIEKINTLETTVEETQETQEKRQEIRNIMHQISQDIDKLKQEVYISQNGFQLTQINTVEEEIHTAYKKIQTPQTQQTPSQTPQTPQTNTPKINNENISKFLVVYREKDKIIEEKNKAIYEKNKSIYILQQKLTEAENQLKQHIKQAQNDKDKDKIIQEKTQIINTLEQRIQEVENKFKKIALLHKSIAEKEQIKDNIIEEKNKYITHLQKKVQEIEEKFAYLQKNNEESKEHLLQRKLSDIDKKIQAEKAKTRIFISLVLLCIV